MAEHFSKEAIKNRLMVLSTYLPDHLQQLARIKSCRALAIDVFFFVDSFGRAK